VTRATKETVAVLCLFAALVLAFFFALMEWPHGGWKPAAMDGTLSVLFLVYLWWRWPTRNSH
jgi:hypothetical protein